MSLWPFSRNARRNLRPIDRSVCNARRSSIVQQALFTRTVRNTGHVFSSLARTPTKGATRLRSYFPFLFGGGEFCRRNGPLQSRVIRNYRTRQQTDTKILSSEWLSTAVWENIQRYKRSFYRVRRKRRRELELGDYFNLLRIRLCIRHKFIYTVDYKCYKDTDLLTNFNRFQVCGAITAEIPINKSYCIFYVVRHGY